MIQIVYLNHLFDHVNLQRFLQEPLSLIKWPIRQESSTTLSTFYRGTRLKSDRVVVHWAYNIRYSQSIYRSFRLNYPLKKNEYSEC